LADQANCGPYLAIFFQVMDDAEQILLDIHLFFGSSSFCVDLIYIGIKPTQNDKNKSETAG